MELKIRNGEYVFDGSSALQKVEGNEELIQRVLYKLTARRECFPFLPERGRELYRLGYSAGKERCGAAEQAVREALQDATDVELQSVMLADGPDNLHTLRVYLAYRGQALEVALTVQ